MNLKKECEASCIVYVDDIVLIDKKYPDYKKSDDESSYSSGWTDPIPVFFGLE